MTYVFGFCLDRLLWMDTAYEFDHAVEFHSVGEIRAIKETKRLFISHAFSGHDACTHVLEFSVRCEREIVYARAFM